MSKKSKRERANGIGANGVPEVMAAMNRNLAADAVVSETMTDPQAIAAAMEDTVDVVSETLDEPAPPSDSLARATSQAGRDIAGQPSSVNLEDALAHWGLEAHEVLAWREVPEVELVIVTAGSCKVRWPNDMARDLTPSEKGRPVTHPGLYTKGYLRREADR